MAEFFALFRFLIRIDKVTEFFLLIISILGIWFLEIEQTIIITSFVIIIAALIVSQQRSLVFKILGKLEKVSFLRKIVKKLFETFDTIHSLLKPKLYAKSLGYSVTGWLVESVAVYLIFLGFNIDLSLPTVILIFAVSSIIGGLSMLPGGISSHTISSTGIIELNCIRGCT